MMPERLAAVLAESGREVDAALERCLPVPDGPARRLAEAMRYSVFAGGKRLRPALVLLASDLCHGPREQAMPPACAIELVHTYSLIHDDLPAIDDDDLRRGRPSCHKAFGEATAILAGDALLTLAFDVLARPPGSHLHFALGREVPNEDVTPRRAAALVAELARGAGVGGMLAGQQADMDFTGEEATAERVSFIHRHKTAALIRTALRLGALAADAGEDMVERLGRFGELLGLAFQVTDDALDVECTSEQLGKTPGKDVTSGKITYPAVFGLAESRRRAAALVERAIAELASFGPSADLLRDLAHYVAARKM